MAEVLSAHLHEQGPAREPEILVVGEGPAPELVFPLFEDDPPRDHLPLVGIGIRPRRHQLGRLLVVAREAQERQGDLAVRGDGRLIRQQPSGELECLFEDLVVHGFGSPLLRG